MGQKLDTQSIGLDIGLSFVKWLTGAENLHYGLWDGLDVNAGNLGAAQSAYTERLFGYLPKGKLRILDIGGGAGETARKLLELGHQVDIVVPSPFLASRCRQTAPGAKVHEMGFENFQTDARFDLCLFSESYQYIGLRVGLAKALNLLAENGRVIIADCFRRACYYDLHDSTIVGGGHNIEKFRDLLNQLQVSVEAEEDITSATAPSVEIEQGLFNVLGMAQTRVDNELRQKKPFLRGIINRVWRLCTKQRSRDRMNKRLHQSLRNRDEFAKYNQYLMMRIAPE